MKVIIGVGASGMLLGGLYAGDALTAGQVYDMPLEQAYSELSSMPLPGPMVQATTGIYAASVAVRRSPQTIDWHFQIGGKDIALFTARLSPEGANRTRVRIEYTPGEPLAPELRDLSSATLTRDLARVAMSEQVEAQLEHRPIDESEIADAMARHIAAHPEQVREYGRAAGNMVMGLRRQIDEASQDLAAAHALDSSASIGPSLDQSAMDAASRPSVVLTPN